MMEDFLVFLQEISETVTGFIILLFHCFDLFLEFFSNICAATGNAIGTFIGCITNSFSFIYNVIAHCLQNFGDLFNLIGKSIILLLNLVPRTIYLIYVGSIQLFRCSKENICQVFAKVRQIITTASPELLLGIVVGTIAMVTITRYTVKTIRERNITWGSVLRTLLWLVCTTYIFIFRSIARYYSHILMLLLQMMTIKIWRCVGLTLTVMEMTVSNLRVPMFAHAGGESGNQKDFNIF